MEPNESAEDCGSKRDDLVMEAKGEFAEKYSKCRSFRLFKPLNLVRFPKWENTYIKLNRILLNFSSSFWASQLAHPFVPPVRTVVWFGPIVGTWFGRFMTLPLNGPIRNEWSLWPAFYSCLHSSLPECIGLEGRREPNVAHNSWHPLELR
jgi:hypothetical protein